LGLVVIVAVAIDLQIAVAAEPGEHAPSGPGYVLGALMALVLLVRRRWPLGVLTAVLVLLLIYNGMSLPGLSPVLPWAVPLYNAASAGRLWWAVGAAVAALSGTLMIMLLKDDITTTTAFSRAVLDGALLGALVLLGETVRSRRALAEQMRAAAVRAAAEREGEANRRATHERLHIARELHDVLAHTLAGAAVQAGVAADTLADDPETSRAAIETVRVACREARAELAATLGVLRAGGGTAGSGTPDRAPVPGIDRLADLFGFARDAGVRVEFSVDGESAPVPAAVGLIAYRIVQESLTNVVRHARARSVVVSLCYDPAALTVSITDDGVGARARPQNGNGGYGMTGMRERAASVGGRIEVGDQPEGGYRVVATLPTAADLGTVR
jgi:signal transduction histidine kinase